MDRCLTGTCSSRLLVGTSVRKNLVDKVGTRLKDIIEDLDRKDG